MADRKITDLSALSAGSQATGDLVTIVDVSESAAADKNKKMTMENLFKGIPGDVGIGTASPATTFVVEKSDASSTTAHILVNNSESGSGISLIGAGASFSVSGWPGITDAGIIRSSAGSSNGLALHSPSGFTSFWRGTGTAEESMRIDSSGNVGIGTTAPSSKFDVEIATNTGINFTNASTAPILDFKANSVESAGRIRVNEASGGGVMQFATKTTGGTITEAVRIDSSGNVGIGTTSAGAVVSGMPTLHLASATAGRSGAIRWKNTGETNKAAAYWFGTEFQIGTETSHPLKFTTADTERAKVDANGNFEVSGGQFTVGTTATTGLQFINDGTFGTLQSADLVLRTASAERMRIDTSGRILGGNTSTVGSAYKTTFQAKGSGSNHSAGYSIISGNDELAGAVALDSSSANGIRFDADPDNNRSGSYMRFRVDGSEAMRIDSSRNLILKRGADVGNILQINGADETSELLEAGITSGHVQFTATHASGGSNTCGFIFRTRAGSAGTSERMRIDSSGRLLVGHSSSLDNAGVQSNLQVIGNNAATASLGLRRDSADNSGPLIIFGKSRASSKGGNTVVEDGDILGLILFCGGDDTDVNTQGAEIKVVVDGTPGGNDLPTRISFGTTADNAASPTERWRITKDGTFTSKTSNIGSVVGVGVTLEEDGAIICNRSSASPVFINRTGNDGDLIRFYQGDNQEGSISVSGNTVSLNGGHLARWTQLTGGAERTEILRGSVLSNLDEMCEWGDEDNEQLNRMKISDVEGDVNVAGVFDMWDDDDEIYLNDFYCAMTGDFVIRIAQGTTVARGDLLMSAGDGTAKPQDDDIVRSKTIAKVTSTTVSTTYADGSYCVPCVLMAC